MKEVSVFKALTVFNQRPIYKLLPGNPNGTKKKFCWEKKELGLKTD